MGSGEPRGGQTGHGPHGGRDHWDGLKHVGNGVESRGREDGITGGACGSTSLSPGSCDAPAAAFEKANQRDAISERELFGVDALAKPGCGRRAAALRKIFPATGHRATLDGGKAEYVVARCEASGLTFFSGLRVSRNRTLFSESSGIDEGSEALPDRHAAARVLAVDGLFATVLKGEASAALDFLDLFLPTHFRRSPLLAA